MQTTPGIPLQHEWPYQAKEKTTLKITKIWCLTKKNPKYLLQQCHETLSSSTSEHVCHPSGPGFAVKERASPKLRLLRTSQFSPTRPSTVLRLCKNQMGPHCYPIQLALFLAGTLRRLLLERSETGPPILLVPTAGGWDCRNLTEPSADVSRETAISLYRASNQRGIRRANHVSLAEGNASCYSWDVNRGLEEKLTLHH